MSLYLLAKCVHLLGVALGVGGVVFSDGAFFLFLKNKKVSREAFSFLRMISFIIWLGLVLFIISGLLFFYVQFIEKGSVLYFSSQPFLAKLTIFLVLFINAFIFHMSIFPKLYLATTKQDFIKVMKKNSTVIAMTGAVSLVSWISTFLLGVFRSVTPLYFTYTGLMTAYLAFAFVAFIMAKSLLKSRL